MRIMISLVILFLAACASPAPGFIGSTRHDIALEGISFAVFQKANDAEVVRLGYLSRNERGRVPALMMQATSLTTGCTAIPNSMVTKIPGDTGEARVSLRC